VQKQRQQQTRPDNPVSQHGDRLSPSSTAIAAAIVKRDQGATDSLDARPPLKDSDLPSGPQAAITGCNKMSFCEEKSGLLSYFNRLTGAFNACKTANIKELSQQ
jgi:hypothetical protein